MAIYFDLCLYETVLTSLRSDLKDNRFNPQILKRFYQFAYKNYKDGIIGPKKLAHDVASTSEFSVSQTNPYLEVITVALDLELPDSAANGDFQTHFIEFLIKLEAAIDHK